MTRLIPTTALALCELLSPAFLLWLALALPQPAVAQTTVPPVLVPTQQLTPTDAEIYPAPGAAARQVGFGAAIAIRHDTAMISICNDEPTSGVIYIFARVRGVWTQQQEIVNPCLYGFQFIALDHDWLAITNSGYAFDGQPAGSLIYRRENLPRSSEVRFVPYGNISDWRRLRKRSRPARLATLQRGW